MRTTLRSKVTLLFIAFAVAIFAVAGTAMALVTDPSGNTSGTTAPSPTITSDKADYAPGELVTLTGGNWQPGESVNIKVNDDVGQTWSRNVDVSADDSGNITDSFNLPDWFVATYTVTATGPSGTATTSFTDGNVTVRARAGNTPLAVSFPAGAIDRFNNTTCTAPVADSSDAFSTNGNNNNYTNSQVDANNTQSVLGEAPSPVTVNGTTYTFTHWTAESPSELVVSSTGCISRSTPNQGNNPAWQITANYTANSAPTNVALSPSSVAENQASGTEVGTLSSTDANSGDTHTYTLVSGTGDADNASFSIVGDKLKTAASFNFENKSSYSVRVRSTDAGGLTFEKQLTVTATTVRSPSRATPSRRVPASTLRLITPTPCG